MCIRYFLFLLLLPWLTSVFAQEKIWYTENGDIRFTSDAPLEVITAESKAARGVIEPGTRSFAFAVKVNTFQGFNSDLQRVHFQENYMEQKKYEQATFTGKLIEEIPFETPGTYAVRAKGDLVIHGIAKERIIKGSITIGANGGKVSAQFTVPLSDHGISIPKIVHQKIAEVIKVDLEMDFRLKDKL